MSNQNFVDDNLSEDAVEDIFTEALDSICTQILAELKWLEILPIKKQMVKDIQELWSQKKLELSFMFTSNQEIRKINAEYRGKDKATNVLSFPFMKVKNSQIYYDDLLEFLKFNPQEEIILGEVLISAEQLLIEAEQQQKLPVEHFIHLVTHSVMHIFGYDHEDDADAQVMEEKEISILATLGVANPYI